MTLARQLEVLVAALAALVFVTGVLVGIGTARGLVDAQLAERAGAVLADLRQVARTAVDSAAVARAADAYAAGGCCEYVRVGVAGSPALLERSLPGDATVVPHWFRTLFPLGRHAVRGAMPGMAGWDAEVRPARARAYGDLWVAAGSALLHSAVAAAVVLLAGWLGVRALLAPLGAVAEHARALVGGGVAGALPVPRAVDLESLVRDLGTLGRKFEQMLQGAQGLALALREQVATDPLTGLASRRRLVDVLGSRRHDPERGRGGLLLLVQVEGLSGLNETLGYAAGDDLLREVAGVLSRLYGNDARNVVAHLAGADFAVLLDDVGEGDAGTVEDAAVRALAALQPRPDAPASLRAKVGSAPLTGQSISALFGEADRALRARRLHATGSPAGPSAGAREAGLAVADLGGGELEGRVSLVFQPVVAATSQVLLHEEAFARVALPGADAPVPAGEYLAAATGPGAAAALDRAVVRAALAALAGSKAGVTVAVNLTPASVADGAAFADWLAGLCRDAAAEARRLVLEVPEHCLPEAVGGLQAMAGRLGPYGVGLAIDHLGMGFGALGCLRAAPLRYLKIDGSFAAHLGRDPQSQFFVRAVAQIAHGLDMAVLLEAVEAERVWAMLPDLQVDGGQGYHLGRPA